MITGIRVIEIDWWSIESVDLIGLVGFKECWLDLGVDWRNSWGVNIVGNWDKWSVEWSDRDIRWLGYYFRGVGR